MQMSFTIFKILIAFFFTTFIGCFPLLVKAQSGVSENLTSVKYTVSGNHYILYDFPITLAMIKTKYFAKDAYSRFASWRSNKKVLLVTTGAFSTTFDSNASPVGLCMDQGNVISRSPELDMDALVIIYSIPNNVQVLDIKQRPLSIETETGTAILNPMFSASDRYRFLKWASDNYLTFFQTHLLYSFTNTSNFTNLRYGDKRERRFLAVCKKFGQLHHLIIDAPDLLELNLSASYAKAVLDKEGYQTLYILNLDTGDKNLLYVMSGGMLKNMEPYIGEYPDRAKIENATNLLVYYSE